MSITNGEHLGLGSDSVKKQQSKSDQDSLK